MKLLVWGELTVDRAHKFCPCLCAHLGTYVYICVMSSMNLCICVDPVDLNLWICHLGWMNLCSEPMCDVCIYMCDVLYVWICLSFLNVFIWLNDVIWMFIYMLSECVIYVLSECFHDWKMLFIWCLAQPLRRRGSTKPRLLWHLGDAGQQNRVSYVWITEFTLNLSVHLMWSSNHYNIYSTKNWDIIHTCIILFIHKLSYI